MAGSFREKKDPFLFVSFMEIVHVHVGAGEGKGRESEAGPMVSTEPDTGMWGSVSQP